MKADIVCMFCKVKYGEREIADVPDVKNAMTHGICPACFPHVQHNGALSTKREKEIANGKY